MRSKIESMKVNDVWILVDLSEEVKSIRCKWVFKRKRSADEKVETYKAHFVIKGYRQHYGIDYDEIFSLVIMLKFIQIMLAIAAHTDYKIWKIDVKIVFLNGELEGEVYMIQLESFTSINESKVCKL